jgi:hypothetical protein
MPLAGVNAMVVSIGVFVGEAVEAVAPHPLLVQPPRQGQPARHHWQLPVEVRVEAGDLRQSRIVARNCVDDGDLGGQVQRRKVDELAQRVEQRAIDERRRVMDGTAMDEPMRHRLRMQVGRIQGGEGGLHGGRMIGKVAL